MKLHGIVVVGAFALTLGGCASVTRGTTEPVAFVSDPPGAAMTTDRGGYACPSTPCSLDVGRSDSFNATFTKAGYQPQTVPVVTEVVGTGVAGAAGNIILGGLIGLTVDAVTGATMDHKPNPVSVTLVPVGRAVGPARRARRGRPTT